MRLDFKRLLAALLALATLSGASALAWAASTEAEPENSAVAAETTAPDGGEAEADGASDTQSPAPGYVLVTTATQTGWLPLPEEGEVSLPLQQVLPDGTECENIIHLSPTGVYMEDSTCENHDCVNQGEVSLDNRQDRILGNMIICLPNQVVLELYTPEELLELMKNGRQAE